MRTDDFPRELEDRKKKLKKYEKLKKLIKLKDEIIWNLVNDEMVVINQKTQSDVSNLAK